jgi:predicted patatin/cPLA2 family phospholipase
MVILNHRNASGVLDEDQPCPRKVKMIDKTDYAKTAQKAANDGMETFLNWGKAAIDNTFSMYEQGIAAQESNIAEARKQFQELESNLTQKWNNQKQQFKSMAMELSEAYWPESKQLMEKAEKLYQDNINQVVSKNREMLESNIDRSIESTLNIEKEWVSQLRENYTHGAEKLRKQFDTLMSQAVKEAAKK